VFEQELAFANELVERAAAIALSYFQTELEVQRKDDLTPVTEADLRIEAMIREAVAERFPGDAVLGEEGGLGGTGERVWVVDPIDGTKNFADGIQIWASLIALTVDGRPMLGMANAPALGERYDAVRGSGARLNGRPIRVSDVADLSDAMVVSSGLKHWCDGPRREPFRELVRAARRARAFGDFWGHMLVARGAAEAMLEPTLRVWDYAAVQVIVEEAGGRMTGLDGGPLRDGGSALTTNGLLHEEIVRRFREVEGVA